MTTESTELEVVNKASACTDLAPADMKRQIQQIQHMMQECMKEGTNGHYGTIPGCGNKPTLFKSGAEKLSMMFHLAPSYEVCRSDYDNGHREYEITCTITHSPTGNVRAQGVGACSTMEGKYKYRQADKEITSNPVPKEYWDTRQSDPKAAQQMIGGPGFGTKKTDDGQWMITKGGGDKVEHDNPADYWNTCLKMAKKRAYVDAMLSATAASDIFTQDIEDMPEVIPAVNNHQQQQAPPAPQHPNEEHNTSSIQEQAMDLFDSVKNDIDDHLRQWCMDGLSAQYRNYQGVIDELNKWKETQGAN